MCPHVLYVCVHIYTYIKKKKSIRNGSSSSNKFERNGKWIHQEKKKEEEVNYVNTVLIHEILKIKINWLFKKEV